MSLSEQAQEKLLDDFADPDLSSTEVQRVRLQHNFQYLPYQSISMDATISIPNYAVTENILEESMNAMHISFGRAFLLFCVRYEKSKKSEALEFLKKVVPRSIQQTIEGNPILMDAIIQAAEIALNDETKEISNDTDS